MLKGCGVGEFSPMQWRNKPWRQPAAMSQSVEARAMSINAITIRPHTKAMTCKHNKTRIIIIWSVKPILIKDLTHYCPAVPFGNRNIYFRGSFHFSIVTI